MNVSIAKYPGIQTVYKSSKPDALLQLASIISTPYRQQKDLSIKPYTNETSFREISNCLLNSEKVKSNQNKRLPGKIHKK